MQSRKHIICFSSDNCYSTISFAPCSASSLIKSCQSLTIRTHVRLRPPFWRTGFIRIYTSFLNLEGKEFYSILLLLLPIRLVGTDVGAKKRFLFSQTKTAQTFRPNSRFQPFTSNWMAVFYKKQYFHFSLNRLQMTRKTRPLSTYPWPLSSADSGIRFFPKTLDLVGSPLVPPTQCLPLPGASDYREHQHHCSPFKLVRTVGEAGYYWTHSSNIQTYRVWKASIQNILTTNATCLCSTHLLAATLLVGDTMDPLPWENWTIEPYLVGRFAPKLMRCSYVERKQQILTTKLGLFLET